MGENSETYTEKELAEGGGIKKTHVKGIRIRTQRNIGDGKGRYKNRERYLEERRKKGQI